MWIGLYWTRSRTTTLDTDVEHYNCYLCIIPCFPIIFTVDRNIPQHRRHVRW